MLGQIQCPISSAFKLIIVKKIWGYECNFLLLEARWNSNMEKVTLTYASMKRFSYPNLMSNFFGSNHAERIPAYATICVNLIHEVFFSSRDIKQLKEVNHTYYYCSNWLYCRILCRVRRKEENCVPSPCPLPDALDVSDMTMLSRFNSWHSHRKT